MSMCWPSQSLYIPFSVIDSISEAWCVNNGELQLDTFLLNIHSVFGDLHCLSDPLCGDHRDIQHQYICILNYDV